MFHIQECKTGRCRTAPCQCEDSASATWDGNWISLPLMMKDHAENPSKGTTMDSLEARVIREGDALYHKRQQMADELKKNHPELPQFTKDGTPMVDLSPSLLAREIAIARDNARWENAR